MERQNDKNGNRAEEMSELDGKQPSSEVEMFSGGQVNQREHGVAGRTVR